MKILFVGDITGNNGPANVNKALKQVMPVDTLYSVETKKIKRVFEILTKSSKVDAVVCSGLSKSNIISFKVAKFFNKKSAYLMHGCTTFENEINKTPDLKSEKLERKVLKNASIIICVSEPFKQWLVERFPEFKKKITYVNNGIDWSMQDLIRPLNLRREKNKIISIGGGVPIKKIVSICKAIQILNNSHGYNLGLTVIGRNGLDTEVIKGYSFVTYIEKLSREEVLKELKSSQLYIQNSAFETFGLSIVEALLCECNIIMSKSVGVKAIFNDLTINDIIIDTDDIAEIVYKIITNLENSNNSRLIDGIDKERTTVLASYSRLLEILRSDVI